MSKPVALSNDEQVIQRVLASLQGLKYGSIQITVHAGKVTQVDKIERTRFTLSDSIENGALI